MQSKNYEMFTPEGNELVHRIVLAAQSLAKFDPIESVWEWTQHELHKLSYAEGYGEATDTAVREAVHDAVVCS